VKNLAANETAQPVAGVDEGWSVRRLVVSGLVIFAVQTAIVYATGSRPSQSAAAQPKGPSVRWISRAISPAALATLFGVADPAGAVLPGPHGFSAESWLRLPALPQVRIGWVDATHWLALRTNSLGQAYSLVPQTSRPLLAASARAELPDQLRPPLLPIPTPLRTSTLAALGAELAERLEGSLPSVPALTHADVLKDTAVRLTVDAEGRVLLARLVERSGLPEADQLAVKTAMDLRFKPRAGAGFLSGVLRIQWNTLPSTGEGAR
jgi:TonB family protein